MYQYGTSDQPRGLGLENSSQIFLICSYSSIRFSHECEKLYEYECLDMLDLTKNPCTCNLFTFDIIFLKVTEFQAEIKRHGGYESVQV